MYYKEVQSKAFQYTRYVYIHHAYHKVVDLNMHLFVQNTLNMKNSHNLIIYSAFCIIIINDNNGSLMVKWDWLFSLGTVWIVHH